MDENMKNLIDLTSFPFIIKKIDVADYTSVCPVNDILKVAIKNGMPELKAMGMLYVELAKIFPSFAVQPTVKLNFEQDSHELKTWMEQILRHIDFDLESLFFNQEEDNSSEDEDPYTYSISLFGSDSDDKDLDWIFEANRLTEKSFHSETLNDLFKFRQGLFLDFKKIDFLEKGLLYGYCVLLLVKACRMIDSQYLTKDNNKHKRNIVFGLYTESELTPYQELNLTNLI